MRREHIIWLILLLGSIIISTFIHEVGHGITAYTTGIHVSTGFNKVGDAHKKPSDKDFRVQYKDLPDNPLDLGPIVTWFLAITFTLLLYLINKQYNLMIVGAFAFANSFLRLIPVVHSYFSLITSKTLAMEDEIGMGNALYEIKGILVYKFVPSLLSIVVSAVCLYFVLKRLKTKIPALLSTRAFLLASFLALVISFPLLRILDELYRINW